MERVNLFNPFKRRPPEHEDSLTWSFLVALRLEPALQRLLRDLVLAKLPRDRFHGRHPWDPALVQTQTDRIGSDAEFIVSVLLSDEPLEQTVPVAWVDREARYDGVVQFSDGLVLVIENKPAREDVWEGQLSLSRDSLLVDPKDVDLYEVAVSVTWPEILEEMLLFAGSGIPSFAGRQIARDFLELVEDVHPSVSPYRTYELCGDRLEALEKRTEVLVAQLAEKVGLEVRSRSGRPPFLSRPGQIAEEAQVTVQREGDGATRLRLAVWPGDTVTQARRFFDAADRDEFLALVESGWSISPNLHFSFMSKHLVWADTRIPVEQYFDYYKGARERYGQLAADKKTLDVWLERWMKSGLMKSADAKEMRRQFVETDRQHVNVIPGFTLFRVWDLVDVLSLESEDELKAGIVAEFDTALSTWGESMAVGEG